jgi:hypothetical protein
LTTFSLILKNLKSGKGEERERRERGGEERKEGGRREGGRQRDIWHLRAPLPVLSDLSPDFFSPGQCSH